MRTTKKEKIPPILYGLLLLGLVIQFVLVFMVQGRYSFMLEDRDFCVNMATGEGLASIGDILQSIPVMFRSMGGSVLSGVLLQITLLLGQTVANILDTVLLFAVAALIGRTIGAKKQLLLFTAIPAAFLIALNGDWAYSYFWQFGVIQYTLPAVSMLLVIMVYTRALNEPDRDVTKGKQIVAWIFAFLCAFQNGAYGLICMAIIGFAILLEVKLQGRDLSKWMIVNFVFSLVGEILYLAAPGNYGESSIMRGVYLAVSTFPAVVMALLILAILLRTGGFLSSSQILLLLALCTSVALCFVLGWIPVCGANGIQIATLILAITLFSSLLHSMNHQQPTQWKWSYLVAGCGFMYTFLSLILYLTGVM